MKPTDLKCPFKWKERQPCLEGGVLFVPIYYFEHQAFILPPFNSLFGREAPTFIEYCSGNGDWVVAQAEENPDQNWIAVEKRFDRVRKIWSKRENKNLKNLLIVSGEAHTFSQFYLPPTSLSGIYINFPDPWPKGKHSKHRLFHPQFVEELARTSKPSTKLTMVSDDPIWVERTTRAISENPCFHHPLLQTEHPQYQVASFFQKLWTDKGKTIHYLIFTRNPS